MESELKDESCEKLSQTSAAVEFDILETTLPSDHAGCLYMRDRNRDNVH